MSKELFPHKIIWLASYPKSGNTWFRALLTALLNDGEVMINDMETDGIFSSREIFDNVSDIDPRDLDDEEIKLLLPDVYRQLAKERPNSLILKVHDAYTLNSEDIPIIPADVTHCAVYIMRNPLDVAGSLANHINGTIDQAIALMNNKQGCLAAQKSTSPQLKQLMLDWSGHVLSWTTLPSFPVYIVRYEDMIVDAFKTFSDVLQSIGWHYTDSEIRNAIAASSFENLSRQEQETGFKEKAKASRFFRGGKTNNWEHELSGKQVARIIHQHEPLMKKYGYLPPDIQ